MTLNLAYQPLAQTWHNFSFNINENLPLSPNYLWKIESGIVKITTYSEEGSLIVLGLWGEGDIVSPIFTKIEYCYITSLTKVVATNIYYEPNLLLTKVLFSHLKQLQELTLIRSYKKLDLMLLKLLQWLGDKFGLNKEEGILINVRFTHQELADILGSTRATITKILSQLEQQGIIKRLSCKNILLIKQESFNYEI